MCKSCDFGSYMYCKYGDKPYIRTSQFVHTELEKKMSETCADQENFVSVGPFFLYIVINFKYFTEFRTDLPREAIGHCVAMYNIDAK